uniref:TIR domain-containing protein n=1 Tax=Anas platyrhynchos TaxID=8839 RepID=A0A8B9SZG7_ANAPL
MGSDRPALTGIRCAAPPLTPNPVPNAPQDPVPDPLRPLGPPHCPPCHQLPNPIGITGPQPSPPLTSALPHPKGTPPAVPAPTGGAPQPPTADPFLLSPPQLSPTGPPRMPRPAPSPAPRGPAAAPPSPPRCRGVPGEAMRPWPASGTGGLRCAVLLALAGTAVLLPCRLADRNQTGLCKGLSLVRVPRGLPDGLQSLDLSYNKLREITAADLAGLPQLRSLDLGYNNISRITPDAFLSNVPPGAPAALQQLPGLHPGPGAAPLGQPALVGHVQQPLRQRGAGRRFRGAAAPAGALHGGPAAARRGPGGFGRPEGHGPAEIRLQVGLQLTELRGRGFLLAQHHRAVVRHGPGRERGRPARAAAGPAGQTLGVPALPQPLRVHLLPGRPGSLLRLGRAGGHHTGLLPGQIQREPAAPGPAQRAAVPRPPAGAGGHRLRPLAPVEQLRGGLRRPPARPPAAAGHQQPRRAALRLDLHLAARRGRPPHPQRQLQLRALRRLGRDAQRGAPRHLPQPPGGRLHLQPALPLRRRHAQAAGLGAGQQPAPEPGRGGLAHPHVAPARPPGPQPQRLGWSAGDVPVGAHLALAGPAPQQGDGGHLRVPAHHPGVFGPLALAARPLGHGLLRPEPPAAGAAAERQQDQIHPLGVELLQPGGAGHRRQLLRRHHPRLLPQHAAPRQPDGRQQPLPLHLRPLRLLAGHSAARAGPAWATGPKTGPATTPRRCWTPRWPPTPRGRWNATCRRWWPWQVASTAVAVAALAALCWKLEACCRADAEWVRRELLRRLESAEPPYRLCIHERDFVPGRWIIDNIVENIENSAKVIFVLSRSFVDSEWCNYELYFAHQRAVGLGYQDVILVVKEPIDVRGLPRRFARLRKMLGSRTYLEWPREPSRQPFFWMQLRSLLGTPGGLGGGEEETDVDATSTATSTGTVVTATTST